MRCHSNCDDNTAGYVGRPSFPERLLLVLHIPSRTPQKDWLKKLFQKQKCCYFWSPGNQRKKRLYTTRKKLSKQARMAVGNFQKLSWWMTPFFISFPRWLLTKKGRNYTAITKENKYNSIKSLALFFARWRRRFLRGYSYTIQADASFQGFLLDFYIASDADQNDVFCDSLKTRPSVFLVKTRLRITKGSEQE